MTPAERRQLLERRALELGFQSCGVTDLSQPPHQDALRSWLARGFHGTMAYMERQASRRADPATIMPGASRAVMLTRNYYRPDPPRPARSGRVARYARGRDYHVALAGTLAAFASYIESLGPTGTRARAFLDAGPVPERELAQRAGLGWIGKNTMLIDPERGSYFFIAAIFTNLDLPIDPPFEFDRCGSCRACLDACPTNAFPAPHVLDSTRCISYLTIEHRGELEAEQGARVADWVFGCDICQEACPWNEKFARPAPADELGPSEHLAFLPLDELVAMDEATFETRFGWTAMERAGAAGLKRNAEWVRRNDPCLTTPSP